MKNNIIPYGRQHIDDDDLDSVVKTLKSDFLTQGPKILEFENLFSEYVKSKYSIAVNNGTSALHLCCLALGLKPGDKIICPTITFAASANCVKFCGGEIIFCDINPNTYLMNLDHLQELLIHHSDIKGVITVDFAGRAVDLEIVRRLSKKFGFWIIQDSCHSPGGYFNDSLGNKQFCGNGNFADLAIFSFHPVKHIACGEGGMVTTNNKKLFNKIKLLRTHGITKNPSLFLDSSNFFKKNEKYPSWYYEMQELGYNYRLTDFQAALGISQLNKAKNGIEKRKKIAAKYYNAFKNKSWIINQSGIIGGHAYHLYIILVDKRDELYKKLRENNIYCQIHYFPLHLMPYYYNLKKNNLKFSEFYIDHCITLPIFPTLNKEMQDKVINEIVGFYEK